MVYLLALHASALQMNTMKFKQDFIGPLFIDTALNKTHYRLKDATGLSLDGTYHMNSIKKGSACTPLGIVDKFDTYTRSKRWLLHHILFLQHDSTGHHHRKIQYPGRQEHQNSSHFLS